MSCRLLYTQPTLASGTPCTWYAKFGQLSNYLAGKLEDFHLAGLIVGAQAPEELILRGIAIRDSGIVQVPWKEKLKAFMSKTTTAHPCMDWTSPLNTIDFLPILSPIALVLTTSHVEVQDEIHVGYLFIGRPQVLCPLILVGCVVNRGAISSGPLFWAHATTGESITRWDLGQSTIENDYKGKKQSTKSSVFCAYSQLCVYMCMHMHVQVHANVSVWVHMC